MPVLPHPFDLVLVMPVYNEGPRIASCLRSWLGVLSGLDIRFQMIVVDDGSTDETLTELLSFAGDDRVRVVLKAVNAGHGPALLDGYREAVPLALWVFQCDSDEEISPEHFPALWERREMFDVLLGARDHRSRPWHRKLISACASGINAAVFGPGVADANVPFRLVRCDILSRVLAMAPLDAVAPNMLISGAAVSWQCRIYEHPLPYRPAPRQGLLSHSLNIYGKLPRCLWQVLMFARDCQAPAPVVMREALDEV